MSNQDHLTEELGRELHRRVDALYDTPLTFEGVRGRARGIRRRRRVAAAGAVAAAVAVVLVVPTVLAGNGAQRSERPQPAPEPPAQTRSVAVLHDGTLTLPDGTTRDLGVRTTDVNRLAVLTDGRVLVANQKVSQIEVYDADGSLTTTYPVDYLTFTVSATNELAAWVDQRSRVQVLESGSAEPVTLAPVPLPGESSPVIDAVVGSDCASGGCRVLAGEGSVTMSEATVDDAGDLGTSEDLRIIDVSPDEKTWAVSFAPAGDQQYGCVGLYDVASRSVTARSCTIANLQFSPDGEHLVGGFFENNMTREVTVLDRDLKVVARYAPSGRVVVRAAWSDATHLLAAVAGLDDHTWTLERVDIGDGSTTTLDGPVRGGNPEMVSEYLFPE